MKEQETRFSKLIFKRNDGPVIYVIDNERGIAIMLQMFWRTDGPEAFMCVSILQEQQSGALQTMSKTCIPCTLAEDGSLMSIEGEFNHPIRYRTVTARMVDGSEGLPELVVKHESK